jgi:hypothetical protein
MTRTQTSRRVRGPARGALSTPERQARWLKALATANGNVSAACRTSGIARRTVYDWRQNDPAFRTRCSVTAAGTLKAQERFLTHLIRLDAHISRACRASGVGRTTVYTWRNRDEAFEKRYKEVRAIVLDDLEGELFSRARKSDRLLVFVLESRFPEVYGRKVKVDGAATVTTLDPEKLKNKTEEEIERALEFAKSVAGARIRSDG